MTIFYICSPDKSSKSNNSQKFEEQISCDIVRAALFDEDLNRNLIAVNADSQNSSFIFLKNKVIASIDLDDEGRELWEDYGSKIYEMIFGLGANDCFIVDEFASLGTIISEFEEICSQSDVFDEMGEGFLDSMAVNLDDNIQEERSNFASILADYYKLKKLM